LFDLHKGFIFGYIDLVAVTTKRIERSSVRISLLAMFSVLLFLSAILSKITVTYGSIVFNFVLLTGVLVLKLPYSGTILTFITSILYSFISPLGPLMLGTFLLKGVTLDIFFVVFKVYRDAYNKKYNIPVIVTAIVLSGIFAGLYQYFLIVVFLRLVDFGAFIVSTIFLVSIISNIIVGYTVPKYVMPRIDKSLV
jgi:hypothetical protein